MAAIAVLGIFVAAACWDAPPFLTVIAIVAVLLVALPFGTGMLLFGLKHPDLAMMEGREVIQYRQLGMATKSGAVDDRPSSLSPDPTMPLLQEDVKDLANEPDELTDAQSAALPKEIDRG